MSSQKKQTHSSSSDKISYLPDEAIDKILSCLPLQEAVNTSILSRKWRFMWRQIPEIIFDDSFCKKDNLPDEYETILIIDQVLLLHTGSIPKFKLSLSCLESHEYVDRIIYSVLRRGITDFFYSYSGMIDLYKMPPSLFLCEQLEHLNLCHCRVIFPTKFMEFGKLVSLELRRVSIYGEACSSLISNCPLLERLTIKDLVNCDNLDIVTPKLKVFRCRGIFSCIRFINTPCLESLSMILHVLSEGQAPEPVVLYNSLPALQFLKLCEVSFKYVVVAVMGGVRNRLANKLNHLKVLKLYGISFGNEDEASSVFFLIKSSKHLEKLTIGTNSTESAQGFGENLDCSGISFDHLTEVKMKGVSGIKTELHFIEYILANAPRLLNMVIVPQRTLVTSAILKEVIQFRRESRLAKITFDE